MKTNKVLLIGGTSTMAQQLAKERGIVIVDEKMKITNPYDGLSIDSGLPPKDGKANRRERRKSQRKNKRKRS